MDTQAFVTLIGNNQTNVFAQVASLALLLYDYALTFGEEVDLVWRRNWSVGTGLFLVNRYTGIFSLAFNIGVFLNNTLSDEFCFHFVRYQVAGTLMAVWLVEIILGFRVWALYARSRKILYFLLGLLTVAVTICTSVGYFVFRDVTVLPRPGSFLSGCYPLGFPVYTFALALPELINATILLVLTLVRTARSVRMGRRQAPMFVLFVKDGVLYYLCIVFILLMNAFAFSSFTIGAAATGLAIAIPCALGSRILLNIRHQILLPRTANVSAPSFPTIQFQERRPSATLDATSPYPQNDESVANAFPFEEVIVCDDPAFAIDASHARRRSKSPLPSISRVSGGSWFN